MHPICYLLFLAEPQQPAPRNLLTEPASGKVCRQTLGRHPNRHGHSLNSLGIINDIIITIFLVLQVYVVVDASGTFNPVVRDAALTRASGAGAVLINWFAVACELQKDWRLGPNSGQVGHVRLYLGGTARKDVKS